MWEILSQSSPFSFSHLCFNWGQPLIFRDCKEVRWLIPSGSDVRLGQYASTNLSREVRFLNHSSGRDSNSFIPDKVKYFNLERGGEKEEEEDGNEEALPPLLFISIVSSNAFKLLLFNQRPSSRFGNSGMQVILGQSEKWKWERRGKYSMCWW